MGDSIDSLARSFERHLRVENKAERTIHTYLEALGQLAAHLQVARRNGLASARTQDIEAFLGELLAHRKSGTAANRYRSLRVFYRWLEDEGEIPISPMAKLEPPAVPEQPIPVLEEAALHRLLDVCAGRDFEARRDTALILVLLDAGPRRAEVAAMRLRDVDFDYNVIWVRGKGSRDRAVPFGRKTAQALDRYLRARARHRQAASESLWIGPKGPITDSGIAQIVRRAVAKPESRASTPTSSATPSPTSGAPPAAKVPTSCASPAGARRRCCAATAPLRPMLALGRHIAASRRATGFSLGLREEGKDSARLLVLLTALKPHLG